MSASFPSTPFFPLSLFSFSASSNKIPPSSFRLISASSAIGLNHIFKGPREHLCHLVHSSFQNVHRSHYLPRLAEKLCEQPLWRHSTLDTLVDVCSSIQSSWLSFFGGKDSGSASEKEGSGHEKSPRNYSEKRLWTNVLLTFNILVYVAQVATHGRLLLWGAKVNSLISEGQIWRLLTSAFLHDDLVHLMVNCYSLNSIGPTAEKISGPKRYLTIYIGSAIASSALSYRFCPLPSIGASGAIFGLVASSALFIMRNSRFLRSGKQELANIFQVITINMAIGFFIRGIDNWGHLGGLLGGASISWFVGPLWRYGIRPEDGKPVIYDKAPIFRLKEKGRPT